MSGVKLFVAVSTNQAVSNLPPIAEHAGPGDRVLWIESLAAREERWSLGARGVLADLGLAMLPDLVVDDLDDPHRLAAACRAWRASHAAELAGQTVHLVLNGGRRLALAGLLSGWQEPSPVALYGLDEPAACRVFPAGLNAEAEVRPYLRHTLDLPQVLRASGHVIANESAEAAKFWPGPLAEELEREPYGVDPEFTARLHHEHHQHAALKQKKATTGAALPSYSQLRELAPEALMRWKIALPAMRGPQGRNLGNDGLFQGIYQLCLNLAGQAAWEREKMAAGLAAPSESLGPAVERATARRVHAWLEATRHPAVQSAWRGVRVATAIQPDRAIAEFDLLLVLKSGLLWGLECKSFATDLKDLDARLWNFQQAGARFARLGLCGPLFSDHAAAPWFADQHRFSLLLARTGGGAISHLPLTLLGQPEQYAWPDGQGGQRTMACPSLETALAAQLSRFG